MDRGGEGLILGHAASFPRSQVGGGRCSPHTSSVGTLTPVIDPTLVTDHLPEAPAS